MSRRFQRVVFTGQITVIVNDQPWDERCTIAQVMKQAEYDARKQLEGADLPSSVRVRDLSLYSVNLHEAAPADGGDHD